MPTLSIIVPIYNREKYLKETLESISSQTYKDIEIICVNDGSTDGSAKIIEAFSKQDDRVRIVNKENGGVSSARNAGLDIAKGKYVTFIDGDDLLDSNTFELALKNIENVDIVCFGIQVFGDAFLEIRESDNEYYRIKYNGILDLNEKILLDTDSSSCNKIFKMNIINKYQIRYPHGLHYEDTNFYWKYMSVSKKVCFIDKYFYHYRRHSSSIMAETFQGSPYAIDHLHIVKNLYDFWIKNNLHKENYSILTRIFKDYTLFAYHFSNSENKIKSLNVAREYAKEFFGKDNPTNFIKYLKKGKYYNLLEPDLNFLQKIFSITKVHVLHSKEFYKKVTFLGLQFKHKNKFQELNNLNNIISNQAKDISNLKNLLNEQYEYNKKQFDYFQNIEYETAYRIWIEFGVTTELLTRLSYLVQSKHQWDIQNNKLWLIYISCLIEIKNKEQALTILKKYQEKYDLLDIEKFLVVAKFAKENCISNEQIQQATYIYDYLNKTREQKIIENMLKGKRVAIVGNGPSELGKNKGAEIDSHDIVIRINNYAIKGYENDYGSKTDIWVRGSGSPQVEDRSKDIKYLAVLWTADYEHFPIHFNHLDLLYRDIQKNIICTNFDYKTHQELKRASKIDFPTSGLVCIHWLLSLDLKQLKFYGFSFLNQTDNNNIHYYKDEDEELAKKYIEPHSLDKESVYLREVLNV